MNSLSYVFFQPGGEGEESIFYSKNNKKKKIKNILVCFKQEHKVNM